MDDREDPAPSRERRVVWSDPKGAARAGHSLSGIDFIRAMRDGTLPPPPVVPLLGIEMSGVEPGVVTMRLPVGEHLYNPLGTVHGGMVATILDTVMGCAVHTRLPVGIGYTTLEFKVNFVRAVTDALPAVIAEGRSVHVGRRSALADARLTDDAGKLYATATSTCLVFERPPRSAPSGSRELAVRIPGDGPEF